MTRLLPEKHVTASESLLGLGALVLTSLKSGQKDLDSLWSEIRTLESIRNQLHGAVTMDRLVLAVDFLFAINAVQINDEGYVENATG